MPTAQAQALARQSNDLIADRCALYPDRLLPVASISYAGAEAAAAEIERMAARGARAVMLDARPDLVGSPEYADYSINGYPASRG